MQTQCPKCLTVFNITQQHLDIAEGNVKCTQCKTIFDGLKHKKIAIKSEPPELTEVVSDGQGNLETNAISISDIELPPFESAPSDIKINSISPAQESDEYHKSQAGPLIYADLVEENRSIDTKKSGIFSFFLFLLCSVLFMCLAMQITYAKRNDWAHHPEYGKYIHQLCNTSNLCHIKQRRAIDQFEIETRRIYSHPNVDKALVMSATFRNRASFNQPYPQLLISMSNVRGQEVASRLFKPEEYLSNQLNIQNGMDNGQSVNLSLQLADPGNQAVGFEIYFQ